MHNQTITVTVTDTGKEMELVVMDYTEKKIRVVLGEGIHSTAIMLMPTKLGLSFSGTIMGKELIYAKSVADVADEILKNSADYKSRRR